MPSIAAAKPATGAPQRLRLGGPRAILILGMLAAAITVGLLIRLRGAQDTFGLWHVPLLNGPFLDLRLITDGAESYAQGYDPAVYNPADPRTRIFNYPKVWYLILASGINEAWTVPLGFAIIAFFLIAVAAFPGKLTWFSSALILAALVSPAGMLAFARVNVDFIFFSLMALSLLLAEVSSLAAFGVLGISILFRLIPLFGAGGLVTRARSASLRVVVAAILFTALYFVVDYQDMLFTFRTTQKGANSSYGVGVVPILIDQLIQDHTVPAVPTFLYRLTAKVDRAFIRIPELPYAVAILIVILGLYFGIRHRPRVEASDLRNLRAFWMGAGMYLGTFFIITNWNYRLVFLIFTLPQLAEWARLGDRIARPTAIMSLATLFISMFYTALTALIVHIVPPPVGIYVGGLLTAAINWCLFAGLAYLVPLSLPSWLYENPRALLGYLLPRRTAPGAG